MKISIMTSTGISIMDLGLNGLVEIAIADTGKGIAKALEKTDTFIWRAFLLCSGKNTIWVRQDSVREYETSFPGTTIAIKFRTDTGNDFNKVRNAAISEGQFEAQLKPEAIKKTSKSSGGHYNG